jgi:phage tail-like protein
MADVRSYVSGNFFFQIDGVKCGFIKSVDGGAITAEVINEPSGPSYFVKKHIGTPKYEDFTLQIGFSMSKAVYDWIAASWAMNYQRKNGAIIACDYKLDAKSQREFFNALVTETGIPACDGASKEPAYLTLKFAPEYTRYTKASGKAAGEYGKNEQKLWLPQNFRLTIDGLDTTKVAKVDAFTVKQTAITDDIGDARDYLKEPGKLEFANLKISISEVMAQTWYDWHENFVIKGNNDENQEKNGVLEFLSPNRQDVLLTIKLFNLGIFKITTAKSEANQDQIKRVDAELYCERKELQYGKGTVG